MASLKEIKTRIASVGSTTQITSAMKMISSAKLKKAQDAIIAMRPYAEKMTELVSNIANGESLSAFSVQNEIKKVLLVVVTSNKGLAGAFNSSIIKETRRMVADYKAKKIEVQVLTIGKKGFEACERDKTLIYKNASNILDAVSFSNSSEVSSVMITDFTNQAFDKVEVVYNKFINAALQDVVIEQILPLANKEKVKGESKLSASYTFEPSKETILTELIPRALKTQFHKVVLDSLASEHGARMTAMQSATDNATTLKNQLTIQYNKARQAVITNEIIEIVGAAQALEGK